jgi:hypothetical protein
VKQVSYHFKSSAEFIVELLCCDMPKRCEVLVYHTNSGTAEALIADKLL